MLASLTTIPILAQAEGGSESESGSFLVSPNVGLMIWTLVVFAIAMYVLYKLAFPRIQEALEKRQQAIEDSIETANRTRAEAEEVLKEYRERLKEARAQADDIVTRARRAGEQAEKDSAETARSQREELLAQTRRDIAAEEQRALSELRGQVADLTVLATEKVTRKSLDQDDQRRLVEEALSELDFSALAGGDAGTTGGSERA
jgi:F-type H+-transporting ATPase subunit b